MAKFTSTRVQFYFDDENEETFLNHQERVYEKLDPKNNPLINDAQHFLNLMQKLWNENPDAYYCGWLDENGECEEVFSCDDIYQSEDLDKITFLTKIIMIQGKYGAPLDLIQAVAKHLNVRLRVDDESDFGVFVYFIEKDGTISSEHRGYRKWGNPELVRVEADKAA